VAAKQEKSDLMIQLPWTVPPQPNVQTIVLQQPAKTHMELNASTDKTAISSFALSVAIALILGGLATWLAYWYGRKSFDLTKLSFDAVIAQIKSSERSALDLNKQLFEQQKKLQKDEANRNYSIRKEESLRLLVASFLQKANAFFRQSRSYAINNGSKDKYEQFDNPEIKKEFEQLERLLNSMELKKIEIELHFSVKDKKITDECLKLIDECFVLLNAFLDDREMTYSNHEKNIKDKIEIITYQYQDFLNN